MLKYCRRTMELSLDRRDGKYLPLFGVNKPIIPLIQINSRGTAETRPSMTEKKKKIRFNCFIPGVRIPLIAMTARGHPGECISFI